VVRMILGRRGHVEARCLDVDIDLPAILVLTGAVGVLQAPRLDGHPVAGFLHSSAVSVNGDGVRCAIPTPGVSAILDND
jgi:hypothetical protein